MFKNIFNLYTFYKFSFVIRSYLIYMFGNTQTTLYQHSPTISENNSFYFSKYYKNLQFQSSLKNHCQKIFFAVDVNIKMNQNGGVA